MTPRLLSFIFFAGFFCSSCSTSWKPQSATANEILASKCEIRYNSREFTTPAQDEVTAPASEDRVLPPWKILHAGNRVASIEGSVEGLPYHIRIYLQKSKHPGQFLLLVNITDGDKPVKGFPVTVQNALPEIKKGIMLEIPINDVIKKQIQNQLHFDEDEFLTYVSLVIRPIEP